MPLRTIVLGILLLGLLAPCAPHAYAQHRPNDDPQECLVPNGDASDCPDEPTIGDAIASVITSGFSFAVNRLFTTAQVSAGPNAAAGLRFERHFPAASRDGFFTGVGFRALPRSRDDSNGFASSLYRNEPFGEVTAGYTARLSDLLHDGPVARRTEVRATLSSLVGRTALMQVALAPRYKVVSDSEWALFLGVYASQTVLGNRLSDGPAAGITLGFTW